ncbi:hypothetical protein H2201_001621 [Coniosporium apollinis]|uniref:Chromo domain-containing protein n=1 Tax=Coniosporium apollinis TaxID=61459 RepID=A0ABQ9P0T3_9PEZI|nr:hypothetical protein H2201_001621 [Coniosporium apollinis]
MYPIPPSSLVHLTLRTNAQPVHNPILPLPFRPALMTHPPPTHAKGAKPATRDEPIDLDTLRLKLMHAVPEHCPQAIYTSVPRRAHEDAERTRWFSASELRPSGRRASRTRSMDARSGGGAREVALALPVRTKMGGAQHSGYDDGWTVSEDGVPRLDGGGRGGADRQDIGGAAGSGLRTGGGDKDGGRGWKRRRFVVPDSEDEEDAGEEVEKAREKAREKETRETEAREKSRVVRGTDGRRRYVVMSWKDWSFQEVEDEKAALTLIKRYNSGIDAGNGVLLYVNDAPDRVLHHAFQDDQSSLNSIAHLEEEFQLPHTYNYLRLAEESKQRFRRELEILDNAPEGSPLYYVIWLAVERLRTAERSLDGA